MKRTLSRTTCFSSLLVVVVIIEARWSAEGNSKPLPTELMRGCPAKFMALHQAVSSLGFYSDPNYDAMIIALRRMEERQRQPDKDGDLLGWERKRNGQ